MIFENLPSFNKDHPMKLTLPQQRSSSENVSSLNKDHPMKTHPPYWMIFVEGELSFHWMIFVEAV
jgi:hypothetical protein